MLKWAGTGLCALSIAAWMVSGGCWIRAAYPPVFVFVAEGGLNVIVNDRVVAIKDRLSRASYSPWDPVFWYVGDNCVVLITRDDCFRPFGGLPSTERTLYDDGIEIYTPMWLWFLLFLAPTVWLWYRQAGRPSPTACKHCGYDLTGNVSGRCPECGQPLGDTERKKARPGASSREE